MDRNKLTAIRDALADPYCPDVQGLLRCMIDAILDEPAQLTEFRKSLREEQEVTEPVTSQVYDYDTGQYEMRPEVTERLPPPSLQITQGF
jgi:hypothetical protein